MPRQRSPGHHHDPGSAPIRPSRPRVKALGSASGPRYKTSRCRSNFHIGSGGSGSCSPSSRNLASMPMPLAAVSRLISSTIRIVSADTRSVMIVVSPSEYPSIGCAHGLRRANVTARSRNRILASRIRTRWAPRGPDIRNSYDLFTLHSKGIRVFVQRPATSDRTHRIHHSDWDYIEPDPAGLRRVAHRAAPVRNPRIRHHGRRQTRDCPCR